MKTANIFTCSGLIAGLLSTSGCASTKPEIAADLSAGLEVSAALESVYAARSNANPKIVADMTRLLASAQAAIVSWSASSSPSDLALANAAIAALVAFEASNTVH